MFRGVYTPIVTVFDEKGNFDYAANGRLVDRLIDKGIDGILFLGSIGEFFTMTMDEKKAVIRFAVERVNKRSAVLIGTGGTAVDEVIELTRYAEEEGADGAVVISPYYFKLSDDNLYRYYADVASAVKMPILLYNFPDRTGVELSPRLIVQLTQDYPNIVGLKDTVDSISHTRKVIEAVKSVRADFSVLSGFDEYLIPNLIAGGDGILTGLTNIAPEVFVTMYKAFMEKDFDTLSVCQRKVNHLMALYDLSQPFIPAIKGAVAQVVEDIGTTARKPSASLDEKQLAAIRSLLAKAGLLAD